MPAATTEQLEALQPLIAGARADERGEIEIYCPMHADTQRSASVNVHKGAWYCHAGCGGGSVRQLVLNKEAWVPVDGRVQVLAPGAAGGSSFRLPLPSLENVAHWHRRLMTREPEHLAWLREQRGITPSTLFRAQIGYDGKHYKLPVWSPMRRLWNVRTYDPSPRMGRSKMWNVRGWGKARLYPVGVLRRAAFGSDLLVCEGEWDTLLALQHGVQAVTRTDGAGKPWHDEWTSDFAGLNVYLAHDCDRAGADADEVVADALKDVARTYQCHLPFERRAVGGDDLTDYLLACEPDTRGAALRGLMQTATPLEGK